MAERQIEEGRHYNGERWLLEFWSQCPPFVPLRWHVGFLRILSLCLRLAGRRVRHRCKGMQFSPLTSHVSIFLESRGNRNAGRNWVRTESTYLLLQRSLLEPLCWVANEDRESRKNWSAWKRKYHIMQLMIDENMYFFIVHIIMLFSAKESFPGLGPAIACFQSDRFNWWPSKRRTQGSCAQFSSLFPEEFAISKSIRRKQTQSRSLKGSSILRDHLTLFQTCANVQRICIWIVSAWTQIRFSYLLKSGGSANTFRVIINPKGANNLRASREFTILGLFSNSLFEYLSWGDSSVSDLSLSCFTNLRVWRVALCLTKAKDWYV